MVGTCTCARAHTPTHTLSLSLSLSLSCQWASTQTHIFIAFIFPSPTPSPALTTHCLVSGGGKIMGGEGDPPPPPPSPSDAMFPRLPTKSITVVKTVKVEFKPCELCSVQSPASNQSTEGVVPLVRGFTSPRVHCRRLIFQLSYRPLKDGI